MVDNSLTELNEHNVPIFSVTEISSAVKQTVEDAFYRVRVRGELSGFKRAASGHLYFALKDEDSLLDSVCWKGTAAKLGIKPEDGMEVIATGRITTYGGRSKYQMVVESLELAGEGALLKLLEDRRQRLGEEGLFDADQKQAIPYLPDVIGVVTSPTGAVIRDILHRISDRFPRHVLLWPVIVQGDGSAEQIAKAIDGFNAMPGTDDLPKPDLIIVARGGGSLEDLWAFNEEIVIRAAANSKIPLISAVGHETDTTLIDYASDKRAPTPTAAAEMAVPVRLELAALVSESAQRLDHAMRRQLSENQTRMEGLARGLPNLRRITDEAAQRLDDWSERLTNSLTVGLSRQQSRLNELSAGIRPPNAIITQAKERLESEGRALGTSINHVLKSATSNLSQSGALLESYSYKRTLERGFSLVSDENGKALKSTKGVKANQLLNIELYDGQLQAITTSTTAPKKKTKKKASSDDRQGSLI